MTLVEVTGNGWLLPGMKGTLEGVPIMLRKFVIHLFLLLSLVLGIAGTPGESAQARAAGSTSELKKLDKEIDSFLAAKKKKKKKKHHHKKKKHHHKKKHHKKKKKTSATALADLKKLDKEIDSDLAKLKK